MATRRARYAVYDTIVSQVRQDFPYMKIQAVHDLAEEHLKVLDNGIKAQMPVMEEIKSRISFFTLSPELRNRVYEPVLLPHNADPAERGNGILIREEKWWFRYIRHEDWRDQPALTRVSKAIRAETLPVYYGANEFVCFAGYDWVGVNLSIAYDWLRAIGKNASLIKQVRVVGLIRWRHSETDEKYIVRRFQRFGVKISEGGMKFETR